MDASNRRKTKTSCAHWRLQNRCGYCRKHCACQVAHNCHHVGTDITSRELGNSDQIVVAIGTQLIIEDGSVVANANSFVTDDEYKAYAKLKGYSVPATQPDREANLANAYDFLNFTYEQQLQGSRVTPQIQTGIMPRNYMYAYGVLVANTSIPQDFKNAQMLASFSINDGVDTNAVKDSANLAGFSVLDKMLLKQ